jgi:hypothetical protein
VNFRALTKISFVCVVTLFCTFAISENISNSDFLDKKVGCCRSGYENSGTTACFKASTACFSYQRYVLKLYAGCDVGASWNDQCTSENNHRLTGDAVPTGYKLDSAAPCASSTQGSCHANLISRCVTTEPGCVLGCGVKTKAVACP